MLKSKYIGAAVLAATFTALTLSSGARNQPQTNAGDPVNEETTEPMPDSLRRTSTFYSLRRDERECMSPMCGGYFVQRVNMSVTRCANGQYRGECYVAEIDWNGQAPPDPTHLVVRGSIAPKNFARFGNLGELRVTEAWTTPSDNKAVGTYYLVRDRKVRCIAAPCPTHHEAQLNSTVSANIAGVELDKTGLGGSDIGRARAAMSDPEGAIVVGEHRKISGPGGTLEILQATQIYYRGNAQSAMKPCKKTGCSSQVCADHDVITTCEYRSEYACYKKAECKRQTSGDCGFTMTDELKSCLGKS